VLGLFAFVKLDFLSLSCLNADHLLGVYVASAFPVVLAMASWAVWALRRAAAFADAKRFASLESSASSSSSSLSSGVEVSFVVGLAAKCFRPRSPEDLWVRRSPRSCSLSRHRSHGPPSLPAPRGFHMIAPCDVAIAPVNCLHAFSLSFLSPSLLLRPSHFLCPLPCRPHRRSTCTRSSSSSISSCRQSLAASSPPSTACAWKTETRERTALSGHSTAAAFLALTNTARLYAHIIATHATPTPYECVVVRYACNRPRVGVFFFLIRFLRADTAVDCNGAEFRTFAVVNGFLILAYQALPVMYAQHKHARYKMKMPTPVSYQCVRS